MKRALFCLALGSVLASALLLAGCGKPTNPTPPLIQPTPTPTPEKSVFQGKDFNADKLRGKANQAANSLGKYLDKEDPKIRAKFQHLSDKLTAQLEKDKGHWREKLEAERTRLQPQIERLKQRLVQDGGAARDKLRDQLSALEKQSDTTDQKLSKLETMGEDTWKQFKAQLKADAAREKAPPTDAPAATPVPADE